MIGALQRLASENTPLTSFAPYPSTVSRVRFLRHFSCDPLPATRFLRPASCDPLARNYVDLTCAGEPSQKYLWGTSGAQVIDRKRSHPSQTYL